MNTLKHLSAILAVAAIAACGNPSDPGVRTKSTVINHESVQQPPGRCVDFERLKPNKHFNVKGKKPCDRKHALGTCEVWRGNHTHFEVVYSAPYTVDKAQTACAQLRGTFTQIQ